METLILFCKAPIAGQTKTRLAKERSERDALLLTSGFLFDTARACGAWRRQKVGADQNRRVVLYAHPGVDDPIIVDAARTAGAHLEVQRGADLGERLKNAFAAEFERGARAVAVIGSDSPTLPAWHLDEAFRALAWERVAIGPTFDGGYWLIGAQRPPPDLFTDIPWSTPSVLVRTLSRLAGQGIAPALLPFWYDVDEAADLERLVWHVRAARQRAPDALERTWQALVDIGLVRADPATTSARAADRTSA